ncbi:hypothetical protein M885DRAFT_509756 [Pelagophyceae sp. CCMP2097]|nr:hypothetical protein M885DRAFT_509756 [Pelagophyceae sp. CCMP2097]
MRSVRAMVGCRLVWALVLGAALGWAPARIPARRAQGAALGWVPTRRPAQGLVRLAAKKPVKKASGFGAPAPAPMKLVMPNKDCLEEQMDSFVATTQLELSGVDFAVVDVFVRHGERKWWRIGKVSASGADATEAREALAAAVALQKGLIFWTAVSMRHELMAVAASVAGLKLLQVGVSDASLDMAVLEDGALDDDDAENVVAAPKAPGARDLALERIGFRPDFNPPGFSYKRLESASLKK